MHSSLLHPLLSFLLPHPRSHFKLLWLKLLCSILAWRMTEWPFDGGPLQCHREPPAVIIYGTRPATSQQACAKCGRTGLQYAPCVIPGGALAELCHPCKLLIQIEELLRDPSLPPEVAARAEAHLQIARWVLYSTAIDRARARVLADNAEGDNGTTGEA